MEILLSGSESSSVCPILDQVLSEKSNASIWLGADSLRGHNKEEER